MRRLLSLLWVALVLSGLTVLAWQFRFEQEGPVLNTPFAPELPGWEWKEGNDQANATREPGVLTLTKGRGEPMISVEKPLGPMSGVRFVRVSMDAKWTDAVQGGNLCWATPRAIIFGKNEKGDVIWPRDHAMILALGTQDWHREEAVFDLPPELVEARFGFQHLGDGGTFQVRNVEICVVKQRPWFPFAITALTCLWVAWATATVLPGIHHQRWIRGILAGATLVGATWLLVFPQPRFIYHPLIGQFQLGQKTQPAPHKTVPPPPPSLPSPPPPETPTEPVALPEQPAPPATVPPAPTTEAVVAQPEPPPVPEQRESRGLENEIRVLRDQFNFLHLVAFGAFGFVLFSLAGLKIWPLTAIIVFASEALPNYQLHQYWDQGDIADLAMDSLGLLLAALAVTIIKRFWQRRASESIDPEPASPAAP